MSMPGKQARVLCPVCQEPIPPDETECGNCGAFVIDEAVVRLSRALGLDRERALKLFEAGFRHPKQLRDRRSEEHTSELQSHHELDTLSLHDALPICRCPGNRPGSFVPSARSLSLRTRRSAGTAGPS